MAVTRKADIADQIPALWAADLYSQAEALTFFHNFEGPEGSTMPIIRKDDFTKSPGDTIRVDIVLALTGAGQTGDTTSVEGNEEDLKFRQNTFSVTQLSHGVRWTELAELLNVHDMRSAALNQLRKWLAGKLDNQIWSELAGSGTTIPTANLWAAGSASSRATVADGAATGRLTLSTLTELKAYAQTELKLEPLKLIDGEEIFVLVAHPYAVMQLKRDDTTWAQAQREARERSITNPLFTGAAGMWDGILIKTSDRVPRSTNGTIQVADNVLLGAQALMRGYAMYPDWREELFDYGRQTGIATVTVVGNKLNVFDLTAAGGASDANKTWIGGMVVYSAAVAPGQP